MEARSTIQSEESMTPPSSLDIDSSEDSDNYFTSAIFDFAREEDRSKRELSALRFWMRLWGTDDSNTIEGRNKRLDALERRRNSEYFLNLKAKLENNEKLTPGEYYYFAMVTDDVNKLNIKALETMTIWFDNENFTANLDILIAARRWQETRNPVAKSTYNRELREALINRGSRRTHVNMYLNLRGINLSGADLSMVSLDYADLANANLSYCNLYDTQFHLSDLDNADLSNPDCVRPDLEGRMEQGPVIVCSRARNARLDFMKATNITWSESDFTGSSIQCTEINSGIFDNTIFDECDFTSSRLHFSNKSQDCFCSFKSADVSFCELVNINYDRMDFTGATMLDTEAFINTRKLGAALNLLNEATMQSIKTTDKSDWWRTSQIDAYQKTVAANIIYHLDRSEMREIEKAAFIESVLDHSLFAPDTFASRLAYRAERNIYTLFSSQPHEYYATNAVSLLEAARDRMLASENRNGLN